MKKTTLFVAALAAMLCLGACGALNGVDLTDGQAIEKYLPARVEKFIDPQSTVYELVLLPSEDFTMAASSVTVQCLVPGADDVKSYTIDFFGNQPARESKVTKMPVFDPATGSVTTPKYTTENGVKLSAIDFSKISGNIARATDMLGGEGLKVDGIGLYRITFDGDPANARHSFFLRSRGETNLGSKSGRAAIVTEYSEFEFSADAAGNVSCKAK